MLKMCLQVVVGILFIIQSNILIAEENIEQLEENILVGMKQYWKDANSFVDVVKSDYYAKTTDKKLIANFVRQNVYLLDSLFAVIPERPLARRYAAEGHVLLALISLSLGDGISVVNEINTAQRIFPHIRGRSFLIGKKECKIDSLLEYIEDKRMGFLPQFGIINVRYKNPLDSALFKDDSFIFRYLRGPRARIEKALARYGTDLESALESASISLADSCMKGRDKFKLALPTGKYKLISKSNEMLSQTFKVGKKAVELVVEPCFAIMVILEDGTEINPREIILYQKVSGKKVRVKDLTNVRLGPAELSVKGTKYFKGNPYKIYFRIEGTPMPKKDNFKDYVYIEAVPGMTVPIKLPY